MGQSAWVMIEDLFLLLLLMQCGHGLFDHGRMIVQLHHAINNNLNLHACVSYCTVLRGGIAVQLSTTTHPCCRHIVLLSFSDPPVLLVSAHSKLSEVLCAAADTVSSP
jgi:hypothetical protein